MKTIKFEKPSEEQLYESASLFESVPVAAEPAANATSVLANLIKSLPKSVSSKDVNVTRTERVKGRREKKKENFAFTELSLFSSKICQKLLFSSSDSLSACAGEGVCSGRAVLGGRGAESGDGGRSDLVQHSAVR